MRSNYDYTDDDGEPLGYWRRISCLWRDTLCSHPDPAKEGYRVHRDYLRVFSSFTGLNGHGVGREGERYTEWGYSSSETPLVYDYFPAAGNPCEHAQFIPVASPETGEGGQ